MAVKHKIKNKKGRLVEMKLTSRRAIIENCKECLGWETNPRDCTSIHCAVFPFRTWDKPQDTII